MSEADVEWNAWAFQHLQNWVDGKGDQRWLH